MSRGNFLAIGAPRDYAHNDSSHDHYISRRSQTSERRVEAKEPLLRNLRIITSYHISELLLCYIDERNPVYGNWSCYIVPVDYCIVSRPWCARFSRPRIKLFSSPLGKSFMGHDRATIKDTHRRRYIRTQNMNEELLLEVLRSFPDQRRFGTLYNSRY